MFVVVLSGLPPIMRVKLPPFLMDETLVVMLVVEKFRVNAMSMASS